MSTARSQMPASQESSSVSLHDGWLRVHFGAGRGHGDFHLRWLRHNCDLDRHALTSEPTVDSSELPDQLAAREVRVEDDTLLVTWAHDQRTSRYRFGWLAEHAYARDRDAVPGPPSDVSAIEIRGRGGEDWSVAQALARVGSHGAAVVRRPAGAVIAPENTTELIIAAFADRGLRVVGTHFGRIEDLRTDNTTNRNTDQLGYTDAAVDPHTDQPFLDEPPLSILAINTGFGSSRATICSTTTTECYTRGLPSTDPAGCAGSTSTPEPSLPRRFRPAPFDGIGPGSCRAPGSATGSDPSRLWP